MVSFGYIHVDLDNGTVERPQGSVRLTRTELRVLRYLVENGGRTVTNDELLVNAWGYAPGVRSRTVITTINRLRAKLEADPGNPRFLVTVTVGYVLQLPSADAPVHVVRAGFVGRDAELTALVSAFGRGARVVTLVGPGGVGKTRLASEFLAQSPGAVVVDLVPVVDAGDVAGVLARALGLSRGGALEPALKARSPLVFFDNAEQVLSGVAAVAARCAAVDGVRVLVTSREPLGIDGEQVIAVGPLPTSDAVALLVDRARQARADEDLLQRALPLLEQLVAHLDGLPLAIELAAPRLCTLSASEILERMPRRLSLFADPERAARHGTLAAAVQSSWELLDPRERSALAQMSVFVAPFSAEAVERVVDLPPDAALDAVDVLRRRSLLHVVGGARAEYRLLLSVRDFARQRLRESGDEAATLARWRRHAAGSARAWFEAFHGPADAPPVVVNHEELLAAAASAPESVEALQIAVTLGVRARRVFFDRRVSALLARIEPTADAALAVEVHVCRSEMAFSAGLDGHPELLAAEARAQGIRGLESKVARRRGVRQGAEGKLVEAERTLEAAIRLAKEAGSLADEGAATVDLALVLFHRGEAQRAYQRLSCIESALAPHARVHTGIIATMGTAARHGNRMLDAELHMQRAIAAYERLGEEENAAVVSANLGIVFFVQSRFDDASRLFRRALAMHRERGRRQAEAIVLGAIGSVATARHDFEEAESILLEAAALHSECGVETGVVTTLGLAARARHAAGDLELARARYGEVIARMRSIGMESRALYVEGLRAAADAELGGPADWGAARAEMLTQPRHQPFVDWIDRWIANAHDREWSARQRAELASPAFETRYLAG